MSRRHASINDPSQVALEQGLALHRSCDLSGAEREYRKVSRRASVYGEAQRLRGMIAYQQGDSGAAVKLLRRAVEQQHTNPVFHHTLAEVLRTSGKLDAAISAYRRAWKLQPKRDATGVDLAETLVQAGHVEEAITTYRNLLGNGREPGRRYARIANLYYEHGRPQAARETLDAWRWQAPSDAQSQRELGQAFASIRMPEKAETCYRNAVAQAPDYAEACAGLGSALQLRGELTESCIWFERALELKPDLGWVYAALAANRNFEIAPQQRLALERRAEDSTIHESRRLHMHFALGTWHDRAGDHAQAFEHFTTGNRIQARREPFDADVFDERIERMLRQFDSSFFSERADFGVRSEKPVFIVGMPRSGTSLVEQIIASHPQAHGAGELSDIGRMVRELRAIVGRGRCYPDSVGALDKAQSMRLAQRYIAALEDRNNTAIRISDKMPSNILWLGLIGVLFPGARVVFCRRDALDNCLSCYFQVFNEGLSFCYDLTHLGRVYRQHERLMSHWIDCMPLQMLTVDYESLVANQLEESQRLISFTGLEWDDRCLSFHTTQRDVHTASTWQVRQPMYQSSVARWRAYEPWLGELRAALGI